MAREGVLITDMNTLAAPYIDAAPLDATTTGGTIPIGETRTLRLDLKQVYIANFTATKIIMDHYSNMSGEWHEVHEIASGGASTPFNAEYTAGASKSWSVSVDVAPYEKVRFKVSSTGGVAGETMTIWYALVLD